MKIDQDNQATIRLIMHGVTSWITRHYALRATRNIYLIYTDGITAEHAHGNDNSADPLALGHTNRMEL